MKYRYALRRVEWEGTDDEYQRLIGYARAHFSHVVATNTTLYFNATPLQVKQAASFLKIGTTGFDILTTSELEPSTHET